MLSAAIYAGLVIYSETPQQAGEHVSRAATVVAPDVPAAILGDRMATADGRSLDIAATIDPAAHYVSDATDIAFMSTRASDAGETVTSSASAGLPDLPLVEVTGSQVNLRAGPSTADAVLGSLVRGEQAELVADLGNGWSLVRTVTTGAEGYMADRFLSPLN